jgi:hypothetical protein
MDFSAAGQPQAGPAVALRTGAIRDKSWASLIIEV